MKTFTKTILASMVALSCSAANAEVTIKEFTAGDYIKADEMNLNFNNLKASADTLEELTAGLDTEVTQLASQVTDIVEGLESSDEALQADLADIYQVLNQVNIDIAANKDAVANNSTNITANANAIIGLQAVVTQLQDSLTLVEKDVQSHSADLQDIIEQLAGIDTQLTTLSKIASDNTEAITGLADEVLSLTDASASNASSISENTESISALTSSHEELSNGLVTVESAAELNSEKINETIAAIAEIESSQLESNALIESNQRTIAENTANIGTVTQSVTANSELISANAAAITSAVDVNDQQTTSIGSLEQGQQDLDSRISAVNDVAGANAISITTNASSIESNSAGLVNAGDAIGSNTLLIQDNSTNISTLELDLSTGLDTINQTSIKADENTTAINSNSQAIQQNTINVDDVVFRTSNLEEVTQNFGVDIAANRTDVDYLLSLAPPRPDNYSEGASVIGANNASESGQNSLLLADTKVNLKESNSLRDYTGNSEFYEKTESHLNLYTGNNTTPTAQVKSRNGNSLFIELDAGYVVSVKKLLADELDLDPITAMTHAHDWKINTAIPHTKMEIPAYYSDANCSLPIVHESMLNIAQEQRLIVSYDEDNQSFVVLSGGESPYPLNTVYTFNGDLGSQPVCESVHVPGLNFVEAESVEYIEGLNPRTTEINGKAHTLVLEGISLN